MCVWLTPSVHRPIILVPVIGEGMANPKSNNVRRLREDQLMSKAELARRAGVSVLTIDRIERGESCRMDTKRKIILALGLKVSDRQKVFWDLTAPHSRGA
jgi:DNA-binding XRE family transcriptional regulator